MTDTIVINDSEFRRKMSALLKRVQGKELKQRIAIAAQNDIEKHFDKESDSNNEQWKPLSDATLKLRRNKNISSAKILQDTGRLRTISFKIDSKIIVGTSVDYGKIHNDGGIKKFFNTLVQIPKREWLYISNEGKESILQNMNIVMKEKL